MISLIVAYDNNKCIGFNNTIPWRIKADMQRVRQLTTGQTILMGRKTYESIGRPLPNRINRILTTNCEYKPTGVEVYNSKEAAISNINTKKIFIFGGSQIYSEYLDYCEELFITEIDTEVEGDSYFPKINLDIWQIVDEQSFLKDEENEHNYKFIHYVKRKA